MPDSWTIHQSEDRWVIVDDKGQTAFSGTARAMAANLAYALMQIRQPVVQVIEAPAGENKAAGVSCPRCAAQLPQDCGLKAVEKETDS